MMKQFAFTFILFIISFISNAQSAIDIEMADTMRSSGKIYIVVLVVFIIFIGLFSYLIRLDMKISRIEKELNNKIQK